MNQSTSDYLAASHRFDEDLLNKKLNSFDKWCGNESRLGIVAKAIDITVEDDDDLLSLESIDSAQKKKRVQNANRGGALEQMFHPCEPIEITITSDYDRRQEQSKTGSSPKLESKRQQTQLSAPLSEETHEPLKGGEEHETHQLSERQTPPIEKGDSPDKSERKVVEDSSPKLHKSGRKSSEDDLAKSENRKGRRRGNVRKSMYSQQQKSHRRGQQSHGGDSASAGTRSKSLNTRRRDRLSQSEHREIRRYESSPQKSSHKKAECRGSASGGRAERRRSGDHVRYVAGENDYHAKPRSSRRNGESKATSTKSIARGAEEEYCREPPTPRSLRRTGESKPSSSNSFKCGGMEEDRREHKPRSSRTSPKGSHKKVRGESGNKSSRPVMPRGDSTRRLRCSRRKLVRMESYKSIEDDDMLNTRRPPVPAKRNVRRACSSDLDLFVSSFRRNSLKPKDSIEATEHDASAAASTRREQLKRMDSVGSFFGKGRGGNGAYFPNMNHGSGDSERGEGAPGNKIAMDRRESSANLDDLVHTLRRKTGQRMMGKFKSTRNLNLASFAT